MSENNIVSYTHSEKLISVFSSDYLEKLFYFCLKKTGSRQEAEDLSSDIALNIISQLKKGIIPDRFSAWVWKIARNRYCFWSNKKHIRNNSVSSVVSSENMDDIEDDNDFESALVHGEDLKLLRRELSFISKDYRDIIVAYYIDDLKVRTISQMLNLPENTVMSKLHRSRKILKEGMNMAREFGIRSYKPENVGLSSTGHQPSGLPWNAVGRQLPKNILLQANNNPSTIEELAVELGIAMPYMEEEVKILENAELLKEVNGKYVTNFFIADKECQLEVYNLQCKNSKERGRLLNEIMTDKIREIRNIGIIGETISDNDFKWMLIPIILSYIWDKKFDISKAFKRKDGGNWGFMGFEQHNLTGDDISMGHNGRCGKKGEMWSYSYSGYDIGGDINKVWEIEGMHIDFLLDIMKNKRGEDSFTELEKTMWELIKCFTRSDKNGYIVPNIAVFTADTKQKMYDIIKSHEKYAQFENMIYGLFDDTEEILKKCSNPVLHEQLGYYVVFFMFAIRMMAINDEVESGRLVLPENPKTSTAGMYLEIY